MDALQNYDFTAAASGAEFPLSAPGRLIYYYSGSAGGADNTIVVRAGNTGARFLLKPGQSYKMPAESKEIDTWYISNYSKTAPIIGVLQLGDGDFKDNRISGSVEVVDGGKSRTLAGSAFMGSLDWSPAAGKYAAVQLYNPLASGKNIMVEQVSISSGLDCKLYLRIGTHTALTQQINKGASKLSGGALAVGEMRRADIAAIESGPDIQPLFLVPVKAGVFNPPFKFSEPLVVTPGKSLVLVPNLTDKDCQLNAEWYEENQ